MRKNAALHALAIFVPVFVDLLQVLHGFCSHVIASKPTTLEADKKQLEQVRAGTASNDKLQLAVQYRITKKELLQSCVWQYDPAQMAP